MALHPNLSILSLSLVLWCVRKWCHWAFIHAVKRFSLKTPWGVVGQLRVCLVSLSQDYAFGKQCICHWCVSTVAYLVFPLLEYLSILRKFDAHLWLIELDSCWCLSVWCNLWVCKDSQHFQWPSDWNGTSVVFSWKLTNPQEICSSFEILIFFYKS